jgi:Na+/H+-dicarboxylate symporter
VFKKFCRMLTATHYRYVTWFVLAALVAMTVVVLYSAGPAHASANPQNASSQEAQQ